MGNVLKSDRNTDKVWTRFIIEKLNYLMAISKSTNNDSLQEASLNHCSQNKLFNDDFSNDVVISNSGQTKIDTRASCLSLVSSDFIVF